MTQELMSNTMTHEAFILRTKSGQWMFQVHRNGEEIGGGSGFADQYEAIEAVQEAFPHIEGLKMVVQGEGSPSPDTARPKQ